MNQSSDNTNMPISGTSGAPTGPSGSNAAASASGGAESSPLNTGATDTGAARGDRPESGRPAAGVSDTSSARGDRPESGRPAIGVSDTSSARSSRPDDSRGDGVWSILAPLWAVWVIFIFVLTMLLVFPIFLLFSYYRKAPENTTSFIRISRVWMGVFLPLAGTPLRVRGREKFAKGQSYIVVCNHNALLDVPITSPGIPGGNKTIAKIEMAKIPLFGMMYRTGSVLVDRKDENSRRDSFAKMKETLDMGLHMCIYPEGTRNKTSDPLKPFHDGAFRLALNTGKPIMPAVIFNTRKVMPAGKKFYFRPCRLYMYFLNPIVPKPGDTVETLKEKVFNIMWERYMLGSADRLRNASY